MHFDEPKMEIYLNIFLSALLCFVSSTTSISHSGSTNGKDYIYFPDEQGTLHLINLTVRLDLRSADKCVVDAEFWLYTRKNPYNYEKLFIHLNESEGAFRPFHSNYMQDKAVVMISHGWTGDGNTTSVQTIKNALLKAYDYNVIAVDWRTTACNEYILTALQVDAVGRMPKEVHCWTHASPEDFHNDRSCAARNSHPAATCHPYQVSDMVRTLMKQYSLKSSMVHLIGYSLGAHVMGRAGEALKSHGTMVSRITGLDPALPMFEVPKAIKGLTYKQAEFVDVIHTNAGFAGVLDPTGHADFYPNGGNNQPGCQDDPFTCNHARSYIYFMMSIQNTNFRSLKCDDYSKFLKGLCYRNEVQYMGYPCSNHARGTFYLSYNSTHVIRKT